MLKARMICDLTNETSVKYAELAVNSFRNTDLEIEVVQCVTPATIHDQDFKLKFGINDSNKWIGRERIISPSEEACFASHFREWKMIFDTGQRHIIMEHDAYLWEGMESKFNALMEFSDHIALWNCGIAMECYTMSPAMAEINWSNFDQNVTPIFDGSKVGMKRIVSAGPMAELLTSAKQYSIMYPRVSDKKINPSSWMYPDNTYTKTIGLGGDVSEWKRYDGKVGSQNAPVTQVYCPNVGRTLQHNDQNANGVDNNMDISDVYNNKTIKQMKVIDTL